jgi:hypothetical protein
MDRKQEQNMESSLSMPSANSTRRTFLKRSVTLTFVLSIVDLVPVFAAAGEDKLCAASYVAHDQACTAPGGRDEHCTPGQTVVDPDGNCQVGDSDEACGSPLPAPSDNMVDPDESCVMNGAPEGDKGDGSCDVPIPNFEEIDPKDEYAT